MPAIEPDEYQVWHSSQAENKGSNHVSYKNTRADALLEEYRRTFDPQKRIELYREFQQILNQEQPYTFLFIRSEEHTSELQSRFDLVCRLLLEKKKNKNNATTALLYTTFNK